MDYKIVLMKHAEEDLDRFIAYLLFEKKSEQAARNLLNDFEATKTSLSNVAGSLKLCDNLKLKELGYRRINFLSHRYFMLYRIENDTVYVDNIFHELQDYENKMYNSKTEKKKKYYEEGMKLLFSEGENFDNYPDVLSEYKEALENRNGIIDSLFDEIKIIKKLKV